MQNGIMKPPTPYNRVGGFIRMVATSEELCGSQQALAAPAPAAHLRGHYFDFVTADGDIMYP
eukprot:1215117-Amphidinium_carterae.1